MTQNLRKRISALFKKSELPSITEQSQISEIANLYPSFYEFIQRRFGVKVSTQEKSFTLKAFIEQHRLPPPQIVFMEAQMNERSQGVRELSPSEANRLVVEEKDFSILDVREDWELNMGSIPKAIPLTGNLLDEILKSWDKEARILLYCHFGIRSLDAASYLADRGFKNVYVLKGGIDGWATEIDPSLPRYEGAYC